MAYRIFVDESGTHHFDDGWLIIGMLFVPDHGAVHRDLCAAKDEVGYLNQSDKRKERYQEVHFSKFRHNRDAALGKQWVDVFIKHSCFFRAVVVDWSTFDGKHFGGPFEADSLKKTRAYKKWVEMLLQPEISTPTSNGNVRAAEIYLDYLKITFGYDIVADLTERFVGRVRDGATPILSIKKTDSFRDANQCLQLCDLLIGCLYQELLPGKKAAKHEVRDYLKKKLKPFGVAQFGAAYWRGYAQTTLRHHFPKYSAWFWRPTKA